MVILFISISCLICALYSLDNVACFCCSLSCLSRSICAFYSLQPLLWLHEPERAIFRRSLHFRHFLLLTRPALSICSCRVSFVIVASNPKNRCKDYNLNVRRDAIMMAAVTVVISTAITVLSLSPLLNQLMIT